MNYFIVPLKISNSVIRGALSWLWKTFIGFTLRKFQPMCDNRTQKFPISSDSRKWLTFHKINDKE